MNADDVVKTEDKDYYNSNQLMPSKVIEIPY